MFAEKGIGKFPIYLNAFHLLFRSLTRQPLAQSFNINFRVRAEDVCSGSTRLETSKKLIHYAVLSLKFSI